MRNSLEKIEIMDPYLKLLNGSIHVCLQTSVLTSDYLISKLPVCLVLLCLYKENHRNTTYK